MSSIAGFFHPFYDYSKERGPCVKKIRSMSHTLLHRGPDQQHFYFSRHACLSHNHLSTGRNTNPGETLYYEPLPATKKFKDTLYTIGYDGQFWNLPELSAQMQRNGFISGNLSEAELLLCAYLHYGPAFVEKLSGSFAMFLLDEARNELYLYRDQMGIKPLFYSVCGKALVFASELKGVLTFPGITPELSLDGLNEIFTLGPAKIPGSGVFSNLYEIKPGHFLCYGGQKFYDECYFHFDVTPCRESHVEVVAHTRELVLESVRRQTAGSAPLGCFLSGGLGSSVVTALCADARPNSPLSTFSFDFKENTDRFEPSEDSVCAAEVAARFGTEHSRLLCDSRRQFGYLSASVAAHDLPCMSDFDAALLYFCRLAASQCRIALTGAGGTLLGGGAVWPGSAMPDGVCGTAARDHCTTGARDGTIAGWQNPSILLKDDFIKKLDVPSYLEYAIGNIRSDNLWCDGGAKETKLYRRHSLAAMRQTTQALFDSMDRCGAQSGIDMRMPLADLRLASYLFAVSCASKTRDGAFRSILREAFCDILPESVSSRKRCAFPTAHNPAYEALLSARLRTILADSNSPLLEFVEPGKVAAFCRFKTRQGQTRTGLAQAGQIQTGLAQAGQIQTEWARTAAYYIQINEWLEKYQIRIKY